MLEIMRSQKAKRLMVIRSPAGYGKTSLLLQYRNNLEELRVSSSIAWYTFDESDNNEVNFISYLIESFKIIGLEAGDFLVDQYEIGSQESAKYLIASFLNEIIDFDEEIYIFFDDFQCVTNETILDFIRQFIFYSPPNLHIVISSRVMPDLPYVDMEIHNSVAVIDVDQLKFNLDEVRNFVNSRSRVAISESEITQLFEMSEGWVAGLQLATISINKGGVENRRATSFKIKDNEFDEYFANSVFAQLSGELRNFLLRTAVLHRFNAELACAATGLDNTGEILSTLERENIFLLPLSEPGWYKYHQLFSEFLRKKLVDHSGVDSQVILEAVANWCEQNGYILEAVYYSLDRGDMDRAADLVESCALNILQSGKLKECLSLMARIPQDEVLKRPNLMVAKGWALALTNSSSQARELTSKLRKKNGIDHYIKENLQLIDCLCDLWDEDLITSKKNIMKWRDASSLQDPFLTSVGCNVQSFIAIRHGEYERSREILIDSRKWSEEDKGSYAACFMGCFNANSYVQQGYIKIATPLFKSLIQKANLENGQRSAPSCTVASFYSAVLYEANQLQLLEETLKNRMDIVKQVALPEALLSTHCSMAKLNIIQGDVLKAREYLEDLQIILEQRRLLGALGGCLLQRIKLHLYLNELDVSIALNEKISALKSSDEAGRKGNVERLEIYSRMADLEISIYRGLWDEALMSVNETINKVRQLSDYYISVELEIKKARILSGMDMTSDAISILREMLQLGEKLGLVRVFADNWPYCKNYLVSDGFEESARISNKYLKSVLSCFNDNKVGESGENFREIEVQGLIESLSKRELNILILLSQGLQNKQIADSLSITVDTVKWHLKNIYSKLDVSQRGRAVVKARKLGILPA